jgi:hypothetical protein
MTFCAYQHVYCWEIIFMWLLNTFDASFSLTNASFVPKKYFCFPLVTMLTCINFHAFFMWFIMPGCGAAWSKVPDLSRRNLGWRFGLGDDARTTMACGMLGPRASSRCPLSISFYFLIIVSLLACWCPLWTSSLGTMRMHLRQSGRHGEHLEPLTSTAACNRCLFFL